MENPPSPISRSFPEGDIGRAVSGADVGRSWLRVAGCMTLVRGKLVHRRWSPEQIACRLKLMHPDDPSRLISHKTIYAAIYAQPRGELKAEMIAALRQHKPARGLRRTTLAGGSIAPESLRIIHRPEEIEGRLVPGQ